MTYAEWEANFKGITEADAKNISLLLFVREKFASADKSLTHYARIRSDKMYADWWAVMDNLISSQPYREKLDKIYSDRISRAKVKISEILKDGEFQSIHDIL